VPQKDGTILSAATREEGVFNNTVTGDAISQMVASAKEIFPILGDAEFISASAGVRPGTPDGMIRTPTSTDRCEYSFWTRPCRNHV